MGLFGFGKKKQEACGCSGGACDTAPKAEEKVYNEAGEEMAQCDCGNMCKVSDIEAKKAAEQKAGGCCGSIDGDSVANAQAGQAQGASVKVLGSGCKKCNQLEEATHEALKNLGMDTAIDHVTDFAAIASYGVMTTPALVVDGKVVSFGKVLKTNEVEAILKKARG